MALFLLTTIPFWTSNIIRMISWIPLLSASTAGQPALMGMGHHRRTARLAALFRLLRLPRLVHLYTLFMVVPNFNTMMRIDRSLIEAARDGGANGFQILTNVIIPLTTPAS